MSEYLWKIGQEDLQNIHHRGDESGQPQRNNFFAIVKGHECQVLNKPTNFFRIGGGAAVRPGPSFS